MKTLAILFGVLVGASAHAGPPSFWETFATKQGRLSALQSAQHEYRARDYIEAQEHARLARETSPSLEADFIYALSTFHASFDLGADTHLACAETMFLLDSIRERSAVLGYDLETLIALGICAAVIGEYDRSVEENTLLAYHPDATNPVRSQGFINLGDALMASQDLTGAIHAYTESIRAYSGEPYAWFALAVAFYRNHELRSASISIQRAVSLDPYADSFDDGGTLFIPEEDEAFYRAMAAAGRGDSADAHSFLGEYLSLAPEGTYRSRAMEAFLDVDAFTSRMSAQP